ncbi:MAG: DNA internalization-related competence protein ComEC/Rec2 [Gammaproteobacteria bacterium]|nr:DNA internalization-related competence protein ComEC/Rec2 [Gammaproteobacteria bacterium]
MPLATLAFLAGIILLQGMASLPVAKEICYAFLLLPLLFYRPLRLPLMFFLGFSWALFRSQLILQQQLPDSLIKRDVLVMGSIVGLAQNKQRYQQFRFHIEAMSFRGHKYPSPGVVRLNWYDLSKRLQAGDRYRFTVRLKHPSGMMNPAGFDYEGWLFQQRIRASGYVRSKENVEYLGQGGGISARLHRLRARIADKIGLLSLPGPSQALLNALILGERSGVSDAQWRILRATGTSHLLAISGLHIGLVASLAFWMGRFLWSRSLRLMLRMPAQQAGALFAALMAIFYAGLAGFSIPTQRALIMVLIIMWGWLSRRRYPSSTVLAYAAMGVVLWDPLATLSPGFWLSFAAVATIFLLLQGGHHERLWKRWGRLQLGIFLGLFPLLLFWFQSLSLSAPGINLLAIPWLSLAVMPLLFATMLCLPISDALAQLFLQLAQLSLEGLWWCLQWTAQVRWLVLSLPSPLWWQLLLAMVGCIWLLLPRGIPARWLGGLWLLPLFLSNNEDLAMAEARFTLLDVGQGLAVVIETRDHVLVYDTGSGYRGHFNSGDAVVLPYLRQQGYTKLDMLVVSHGDNDHIGGTAAIREALQIEKILTSVPQMVPNSTPCEAGQTWLWNQVQFELIHPDRDYQQSGASENNLSCVLKITTHYGSVLLSGDIERPAEEQLLKLHAYKLRADYLVAPHHGSRSSSSLAFVEAVNARYVLFPVGYKNRYRFPHEDVTQRYAQAELYDTARHGALSVTLAANVDGTPLSYRQKARRYWHRGE